MTFRNKQKRRLGIPGAPHTATQLHTDSRFLQMQMLGDSSDGSSKQAPATPMGNQECIPISQLQPTRGWVILVTTEI